MVAPSTKQYRNLRAAWCNILHRMMVIVNMRKPHSDSKEVHSSESEQLNTCLLGSDVYPRAENSQLVSSHQNKEMLALLLVSLALVVK